MTIWQLLAALGFLVAAKGDLAEEAGLAAECAVWEKDLLGVIDNVKFIHFFLVRLFVSA